MHGGALVLRSTRTRNGKLTTGAVSTWDTAAWLPSDGDFRVCIRAKLPGVVGKAKGVWPAHWMLPRDTSCDPDEGEMDILEMVNGDGTVYNTYHFQNNFPQASCAYPKGHGHRFNATALTPGWNETYHEFAVERGSNHISFAIDTLVRTRSSAKHDGSKFFNVPFYLILNTALGGSWPGPVSKDTVFPIYHHIDYVRVARKIGPASIETPTSLPPRARWAAAQGQKKQRLNVSLNDYVSIQ